jgi:hypothetical protein
MDAGGPVSLTSSDPDVTIPPLPSTSASYARSIPVAVSVLATGHSVAFTPALNGAGDTISTLTVASLAPDPDLTNNWAIATDPFVVKTTTSLAVSPNPATFGQAVTLVAQPAGSDPNMTPGGAVTFSIEGVPERVPIILVATELRATGGANSSTSTLAAGIQRITDHYDGNDCAPPSDSPAVTLVIDPASTGTVLVARPNPSAGARPVVFAAGFASITGAVPTGAVTFFIDGALATAAPGPMWWN